MVLALVSILTAGCDDPEPLNAAATATPNSAASPALPRIQWLDAHDTTSPERWLASREASENVPEDDASVIAMRVDLNTAAQRFGDPPRMIANRAVQLEEMLAGQGINEHASQLIVLLAAAASNTRPKEGFGAICQHYFNLRKQGLGREAAIEQLKQAG